MVTEKFTTLDELLALLAERAKKELKTKDSARFIDFLPIYFAMAAPDALQQRSIDQLFAIAHSQWLLLAERRPGHRVVVVQPPEHQAPALSQDSTRSKSKAKAKAATPKLSGSELAHSELARSELAIVTTVMDDMPFLMDSICMAIRDAGSAVDWAMHPILGVERDADGKLLKVTEPDRAITAESLIYIACTPLPGADTDVDAYKHLQARIEQVLQDVYRAVNDYPAIKAKLYEVADAMSVEAEESRVFLRWLGDDQFSLFAYNISHARQVKGELKLTPDPAASLGLTAVGCSLADREQQISPNVKHSPHSDLSHPLITKADTRSTIHRPQYLDVISVNHCNEQGEVQSVHHFIGVFASEVYSKRPRDIPLIRRKIERILERSQLREGSHSGKHLRNILHQLPRDELFQASEDELFVIANGVRALRDRHPLRLFMRRDAYSRFFSCLIYLPRDDYSREIRDQVCQQLMALCQGRALERSVEFLRDGHALIHCIVHGDVASVGDISVSEVERQLQSATRTWREQLGSQLGDYPRAARQHWATAFPLSYQEHHSVNDAVNDIHYLEQLSDTNTLLPCLVTANDADGKVCPNTLNLYSWKQPIALSDVLPTLENFGLRVIRQEPFEIPGPDGNTCWLQVFTIAVTGDCILAADEQKTYFEAAFSATWTGIAENDGHQRLVLSAGLTWRQVVCLRTLTKYLIQTGLPHSQRYMEKLLADNADIAHLLLQLFSARFDPTLKPAARKKQVDSLSSDLNAKLDTVVTLDADRVLRAYTGVVHAALRTNFYQTDADGQAKPWVSIKLNPKMVPDLPLPLPWVETFVYSPEVEGIHLRGGKVARGGLRWSDRREDFRTEVLGLMKAQMVKNAIIVPVGAKGGFVVKRGDPSNREEWQKRGIACYETFNSALLDITDNRVGNAIVKPTDVVCYDGDDPYLVVAADKGTASFSDIANGIAEQHGFWLGDAYASGGSDGYDHKKMGITARGAWESVKRHFRELHKDIQKEAFTCIGIGDMSGDVFGNGMLLSKETRLLAAFNHQHIFIDPTPDPKRSFKERERLFKLARSGWGDYKTETLSTGGGIYLRSAKSIKVSAEAKKALHLDKDSYTPTDLISALLLAPVELLWNGGIGTYIKASTESDQDVGDRANDSLRVNGRDLRCKVIGEGGNLGCTQRGRIEFALHGGHINTDAIDNAGGVHSSDREVNIKIPLNQLMQSDQLTRAVRNPLLHEMTDQLIHAVLDDSYRQSTSLSVQANHAPLMLDAHSGLIRSLEREGLLDRAVEFLPDEDTLKERSKQDIGLTRPELAVLMSYSKMSLFNAILESDVPDDPYFDDMLLGYFPTQLVERYRDSVLAHRLRREIIATILANHTVNHLGCTFVQRCHDELGFNRGELAKAFALTYDIYQGELFWRALSALDNVIASTMLDTLSERVTGLFKHLSTWLVTHPKGDISSAKFCAELGHDIHAVQALLPDCLPTGYRHKWQHMVDKLRGENMPPATAVLMANSLVGGCLPDIVQLARDTKIALDKVATVYFWVGERIHIVNLLESVTNLPADSKWPALARHTLRDDCYRLHQKLVAKVLQHKGDSPEARWGAWYDEQAKATHFALQRLDELITAKATDFMALTVASRLLDQVAQGAA